MSNQQLTDADGYLIDGIYVSIHEAYSMADRLKRDLQISLSVGSVYQQVIGSNVVLAIDKLEQLQVSLNDCKRYIQEVKNNLL